METEILQSNQMSTDQEGGYLAIVVVHYENAPEVCRFIDHVRALSLPPGRVLDIGVADNSGGFEPVSQPDEGVYVVRPGDNLGYLNGCRYALEALRASTGRSYAWVVVANTDVAFESDFFQKLVEADLPPDVGIVAPAIRTEDGRVQNPFMRHRPSRYRMAAYPRLFDSGLVTRVYRLLHRLRGRIRRRAVAEDDRARRIYAPHGSVLVFRRHYFERGGTLQFGSFLYGEEIFLAETARGTGQAVWWQPDLRVVHVTRQTTERVAADRRRHWERDSARYLYDTFFREK